MNYDPSISYKDDRIVSIGTMSVVCEHCLALKFKDESKGMCCLQGKVKLEEVLLPPEPLHSLLTGDHQKSKQFMRNIRRYNNAFQMTSFKNQYAKIESERLAYIRNNQTKLRAENYVHLRDALQANEHRNGIGQLVILPSSFTDGPRYLHEKSQDAMTTFTVFL
ncbi:unnamed protein product [Pieris macdunnoughi]|uniref:Helitron helicase-like domain-containing protein n=1 Tax=Pieris macdunnoughi TaxID=345717 RepID=A0A821W409_9NEOP|nr:unnamed protein product [Pieris macdunnoughi]